MVAWFSVPTAHLRITSGAPVSFRSSDHGTRSFCPRCGTALTFQSSHTPGEVDISVCSLDAPEQVQPRDHTRTSAKLSWVELGDLPAFPEQRQ
jgi:hypothetical protein